VLDADKDREAWPGSPRIADAGPIPRQGGAARHGPPAGAAGITALWMTDCGWQRAKGKQRQVLFFPQYRTVWTDDPLRWVLGQGVVAVFVRWAPRFRVVHDAKRRLPGPRTHPSHNAKVIASVQTVRRTVAGHVS